ncbi:hypothetical protein MF271_23225 (plasmid) [Deinococcus sp. KNUC1210]|uniref:hypothetical protein n=1 Tax=Deinococcus sp. KNUC1210 TaxID=2917691 RepID=UPI001EF02367|nr:hypothetical protein [Deinococcus sp. KNUC1210]ULH17890.1 hypothetical protein MF271_23225 [Deinococcus sp. KNUC1210]
MMKLMIACAILIASTYASASYMKIGTDGNGVFFEKDTDTDLNLGVALRQAWVGGVAVVTVNYALLDKSLVLINCKEYVYQGEISKNYIFAVNNKSAVLKSGDIGYSLVKPIVDATTEDEQASVAINTCGSMTTAGPTTQISIPIDVAMLTLAEPFKDFTFNLVQLENNRISAELR